jgi:Archaeal holliday junction resolvase (hjc)
LPEHFGNYIYGYKIASFLLGPSFRTECADGRNARASRLWRGVAMKGGRASRDKGNRAERAIVKFLLAHGFDAERVPLSGSAGGSYLGDLTVPILDVSRVVEVKARKRGFKQLYDWLIDRDILVIRADRSEPLVVIPLKLAAEIAAKAGAR